MRGPIRIATRASAQATAQARAVADALVAAGQPAELVLIETRGDRTQATNVPLHSIGGQGVFTKEIQLAVLDGRADVAVHSAKDLPTDVPDELVFGAFTRRRSPGDALIGRRLADLGPGAVVATGSVRRRAQLLAYRPDLEFVELRGNIHTRLTKIPPDGAIVMAVAALEILGETELITDRLDPTVFVPAVGQGCVVAECRSADGALAELLAAIDDGPTRAAVTVERAYLAELGTGCYLPVGAHSDGSVLRCFLAGRRGTAVVTEPLTGDVDRDVLTAARVARQLHEQLDG